MRRIMLIACVGIAAPVLGAPPRYRLAELPTGPGQQSWAKAVHDDGRVAGARTIAVPATTQTVGVVWRGDTTESYGPNPATNHAWATALGSGGAVFGHGRTSTLFGRIITAWVSSPDLAPVILNYIPQYSTHTTKGVNSYNIATGWLYVGTFLSLEPVRRAYVVTVDGQLNQPTLIPTLGGWSNWGQAVNDHATVVGGSLTTAGPVVAYRWTPAGGTVSLGTLGGGSSEATDINNAGQIVGWSLDATNARRAFLYKDGTMRDLGTLGGAHAEASAINAAGDIVGQSWTADGASAFVHTGGTMHNLNHRTAGIGTDAWVLARAEDINSDGVIVGCGTRLENGRRMTRAFRLDPVCPADWDADGTFNFFDLQAYITEFVSHQPSADLTGDGMLNFFDVASLLAAASECQGPRVRAD